MNSTNPRPKITDLVWNYVARVLFVCYGIAAVWTVEEVEKNVNRWFLLLTLLPLLLDSCTYPLQRRYVPKLFVWSCPAILPFLICACPPVWLGEIYLTTRALNNRSSTLAQLAMNKGNLTASILQNASSNANEDVFMRLVLFYDKVAATLNQLDPSIRFRVMEQLLLFVLILGRWMLMNDSREEHSRLMLEFAVMAMDTLEMFEAFPEPPVRRNIVLTFAVLAVWQASLLRFIVTMSSTLTERLHPELWSIFFSLLLQDVPFFIMRMILILQFNVVSHTNVFYTCKNILSVGLLIYRVYGICHGARKAREAEQPPCRPMYKSQEELNQIPLLSGGNRSMSRASSRTSLAASKASLATRPSNAPSRPSAIPPAAVITNRSNRNMNRPPAFSARVPTPSSPISRVESEI